MMDYNEYHERVAHAMHCPHDVVWMVEPLVTQLNDPEVPVLLPDQQHLGNLINHMAERIDEKDAQLTEGTEMLSEGTRLLHEAADNLYYCTRKLAIVTACWIATAGVLIGVLLGR